MSVVGLEYKAATSERQCSEEARPGLVMVLWAVLRFLHRLLMLIVGLGRLSYKKVRSRRRDWEGRRKALPQTVELSSS